MSTTILYIFIHIYITFERSSSRDHKRHSQFIHTGASQCGSILRLCWILYNLILSPLLPSQQQQQHYYLVCAFLVAAAAAATAAACIPPECSDDFLFSGSVRWLAAAVQFSSAHGIIRHELQIGPWAQMPDCLVYDGSPKGYGYRAICILCICATCGYFCIKRVYIIRASMLWRIPLFHDALHWNCVVTLFPTFSHIGVSVIAMHSGCLLGDVSRKCVCVCMCVVRSYALRCHTLPAGGDLWGWRIAQ